MGRTHNDSTKYEICLSSVEQKQLGSVRLRRDGTPSAHPWPSEELWPHIRSLLVKRSQQANSSLDVSLTAYTPGETLALLREPRIRAWHYSCSGPLEGSPSRIVFVPCAKTKPWVGPAVRRSVLYSAYNGLSAELPDTLFVTISEPLAIVPQYRWGDFPQYDNPGLFVDDAQRSGMTTAQWEGSPFGRCYGTPFDPNARTQCLNDLGDVVGAFLSSNSLCEIVAFVDSADGTPTTHGLMLDRAIAVSGIPVKRYPKRAKARTSPLHYMREVLSQTK